MSYKTRRDAIHDLIECAMLELRGEPKVSRERIGEIVLQLLFCELETRGNIVAYIIERTEPRLLLTPSPYECLFMDEIPARPPFSGMAGWPRMLGHTFQTVTEAVMVKRALLGSSSDAL